MLNTASKGMFSMAHSEFYNRALETLGWSKRELARRLRVRAGTVREWGDNPPGYALVYLSLELDTKAADALAAALERIH